MLNKDLYLDDFEVVQSSLSSHWNNFSEILPNSLVEILTEKWKVYRTSILSENSFICLAWQVFWDKIKKILVKKSCVKNFLESSYISDEIKDRLKNITS